MNPAESRNLVQLIRLAGFKANAFVSVFSRVEVELDSLADMIKLAETLQGNTTNDANANDEVARIRPVRIIIK